MDTSHGIATGILETTYIFDIASAIGTPLSLDESTSNETFGCYVRIRVDMYLPPCL
jgi:hypothetical protein